MDSLIKNIEFSKVINLKELILKYNTNELSSSFMPINFKGESLLAKNVTIHKT